MTDFVTSFSRMASVEFSGKPGEYFKLWTVNLLLTVLTLGVYGAWAKVRNNQYMYGHTYIDGHRLSYLARPLQILKGRLIALAIFAIYTLSVKFEPRLAGILILLFILAFPWLMVQSVRFAMRMTAYRNIRFSFSGNYVGAFKVFILLPVVSLITFGLAFPWVLKKTHQYVYGNITYGGKPAQLNTAASDYYGAILIGIAMTTVISGILGILVLAVGDLVSDEESGSGFLMLFGIAYVVGYFVIVFGVSGYVQATLRNHIYNNLSVKGVASFESSVSQMGYLWLSLTNGILLALTLGLAYPVTQIRKAKYLASGTRLVFMPGLDELMNTVSDGDTALGEEASDLFDADVSLI